MKKNFRSLSLFLIAAILLTSIFSFDPALANAFESYTKASFDDCTVNTTGNTETTAKTATYDAEIGSFSMTYLKGREVSAVPAPSGKLAGTSFTTEGVDKSLKLNFVEGNATNNTFGFTFDSTKNL